MEKARRFRMEPQPNVENKIHSNIIISNNNLLFYYVLLMKQPQRNYLFLFLPKQLRIKL